MWEMNYLDHLSEVDSFSRNEFWNTINSGDRKYSKNTANVLIQRLLQDGYIIRVGRNAYCIPHKPLQTYIYTYSDLANAVADTIISNHPLLEFTIFEIIQMNEFVNHQLAHNTIFVSVESDLGDYVFETLKELFPGKVLLYPDKEIYHQYWTDNTIVIVKLMTEAPIDRRIRWNTCIEKLLVDIFTEPLLTETISAGEYPAIFSGAFEKYIIDESRLFRYARRRGAEDRLKNFIVENTDVELRTV